MICTPSEGHTRSESYSKFIFVTGDSIEVDVRATIKQDIFNGLNLARRFQSEKDLLEYLSASVDLGDVCQQDQNFELDENLSLGGLKFHWSFSCTQMPEVVRISIFQGMDKIHTHIARASIDGVSLPEFMFSSLDDVWFIGSSEDRQKNQSSFVGYIISGINHILSGWDHLVFLLGLILLFQGRMLVLAITGFTLGHSLTLGLGAMNILKVDGAMVEILIGFSILILAIEKIFQHHFEFQKFPINLLILMLCLLPLMYFGNLTGTLLLGLAGFSVIYLTLSNHSSTKILPLIITILFGLIHWLGFASSITEVGLPQDRLLQIILSFNLGVEIGQLAVAITLVLFFYFCRRMMTNPTFQGMNNLIAAFVFSMGTYWFVSRLIDFNL